MVGCLRPRRPQVTLAASLVIAGSVLVVFSAFEQVSGLHTLETREAVEDFLKQPPGDGLGLGVQGMLSVLRVLTMVTAACAAAAAILGYQVLQRPKSARLVLTVLAHRCSWPVWSSVGCCRSIVVGAIVMLWFQPARDWLDGKTPRVAPPPVSPRTPPAPRPPAP